VGVSMATIQTSPPQEEKNSAWEKCGFYSYDMSKKNKDWEIKKLRRQLEALKAQIPNSKDTKPTVPANAVHEKQEQASESSTQLLFNYTKKGLLRTAVASSLALAVLLAVFLTQSYWWSLLP